jgi:2-phosphosulfolactate phosphatase
MGKVEVLLVPSELAYIDLEGRTAVVIDALRATSTIATALANGCLSIYPVRTEQEALSLSAARPGSLLAGERGGAMIPGFDLGNSPSECTEENLSGREMVLTTSNGTPLLLACGRAREVVTAAFVNRAAVADYCLQSDRDSVIICAGQGGRVSFEDTLCAGALVDYMIVASPGLALSDAAEVARQAFLAQRDHLAEALVHSTAGQKLIGLGYGGDLAKCAALDVLAVVPAFADGKIQSAALAH